MDDKDLSLLKFLAVDPSLKEPKILVCEVEHSKVYPSLKYSKHQEILFNLPKTPYIPVEHLVLTRPWPVINVGTIGHISYPDIGDIYTPDLDFYRQTIRKTINYTTNKLGPEPVVLKYATGGWLFDSVELSVSGSVVWSTPYGNTPNIDTARLIMPSKAYIRSVLFWFNNFKGKYPPPKPEAVEASTPKRYPYFYPPRTRDVGIARLRRTIAGTY